MGAYPLERLLAARRVREEAAARETRRAVLREEEARAAAAAAREELERYRRWLPGEEERRFAVIRNRVVSQLELDRHRQEIHDLQDGVRTREEALTEAEQVLKAAAEEAGAARRRQFAAVRAVRKIDEHRRRWRAAEEARLERLEEAELEDIPYPGAADGDE